MMKKILFLFLTVLVLFGCSENTVEKEVDVIIDATQFSGITTENLVSIMGEPESIEEYEWKPKNGELYIYENNKYEFIVFDDKVTQLNVYSGVYWGYDDSTFPFISGKETMKAFGVITTYKNMAKTVNTGSVEKYEPVTEGIQEIEIHDISNDRFGLIRFNYDNSYKK